MEPVSEAVFVVQYEVSDSPARQAALTLFRNAVRSHSSNSEIEARLRVLQELGRLATAEHSPAIEALGGTVLSDFWLIHGAAIRLPAAAEAQLHQIPGIAQIWQSRAVTGAGHIAVSTNLSNHNADHVHQTLQQRGQGVALALLDSGIDTDCNGTGQAHPAFLGRVSKAVDVAQVLGPDDSHGHGTGVGGTALARNWQSTNGKSDDGFAPDATILSYKITHTTTNDYFDHNLISAWQQVFADKASYPIAVANLSYRGSPSPLHPTQQALDLVAYYADVLVVTSSGNDASQPEPTATSQANANGLSVGANRPGNREIASFSSPGPLVGDPDRYFPDLTAMGVNLFTPKPDSKRGTSLPLSGTSFAAPAVAGTALLMRGAVPTLSALDTKAILLNNTEDISAQNSLLTRHHYGLGMLRTDFAVTAAQNDKLWQGQLAQTSPTIEVLVNVVQGQSYAACATWPRVDVNTTAWDNLELFVLNAQGQIIAASESPRNLYERVRFTAQSTGQYKLRLTSPSLQTNNLDWSLTFGPNRGGGTHLGTYATFGNNCTATSGTPDIKLAVPAIIATRWGNDRSELPLAGAPVLMQEAYSGSIIPQGLRIDRIALRRDERDYGAPTFQVSLRISLGHTTRSPSQLSTTFAQNPSGTMTKVLDQIALDLPGYNGLPTDIADFNYVIPLDTPFVTQTSVTQNLLVEFEARGNSMNNTSFGLSFDTELGSSLGRIVSAPGMHQAITGNFEARTTPLQLISGTSSYDPRGPLLAPVGVPQLGSTFSVVLHRAPPATAVVLMHGLSDSIWGAGALPYDLGLLGAPGCSVLTSSDWSAPTSVNTAGQARIDYPVPNQAALSGALFYNQFLLVVPQANSLGTLSTNAGRARIGG